MALGQALTRLHGARVSWQAVDLFADHGPWPLNLIPRSYLPLVTHFRWLWRLLWWLGTRKSLWRLTCTGMLAWNRDRLWRFYLDHPADLVVSVHPLLNHVPQKALRGLYPHVPFATVVTDLSTASPIWYNPDVDFLSASCAAVAAAAIVEGIPPCRVHLLGLPVAAGFSASPPGQAQARSLLGLPNLPTVLLMSGGEGMGPVEQVTQAVAAQLAGLPAQLVVICGRNNVLRRRLSQQHWPIPVVLEGFVDNVADWMAAADCLITKAGPGTIAEAMALGLPVVLSGFIPGQETGNVRYVVDNGIGVYSEQPAEIARIVAAWLQPGNQALAAMSRRAQDLAQPQAALAIARGLGELAGFPCHGDGPIPLGSAYGAR
jgi:1,2-diacylglycerol 3-beta-galactosyltransferase